MSTERPKLELSVPQIIGGALAAASAAVASSWLGVAGTVSGAVIVSLVASVGSALYTHSLQRSSQAIRETLPVVPVRPLRWSHGHGAWDPAEDREGLRSPAEMASADATSTLQRPRERGIRWQTVAVSALASLALAVAVLTGFETLVGRPASSLTGAGGGDGTTVSHLIGGGSSSSTSPNPATGAGTASGNSHHGSGTSSPGQQPTTTPTTTGSGPTQSPVSTPTTPTPTTTAPTTSVTTPPVTTPTGAQPTTGLN